MINYWKIGGIIAIIIALFLIGYYIGKSRTKIIEKQVVEYITLPPVHDTVSAPYPIKEKIDTGKLIKQIIDSGLFNELFPKKTDTVYLTQTDSSNIVKDWSTQREYTTTLFESDSLGKCTINTTVQFNRLGDIDYTFNPQQKTVKEYVEVKKKFIPYIGGGITTFPSVELETGIFINQSFGFALSGNYFFNPNKIEGMPKFNAGIKILKMF